MGGDERRGRKQLTTENTECSEGWSELEENMRGRRKWSGFISFGPLGFSPRSNSVYSVFSVVKGSAGGRKEEGRKRIRAAL